LRILLDENVARPLHEALLIFMTTHNVEHVADLKGWSGTKDLLLYEQAASAGFDAILTNDQRQLQRPLEVQAIAKSGIHRIEYTHRHHGLVGLGIVIGTVCAGLPVALEHLAKATTQQLIQLRGIDPTASIRLHITDPREKPPKFWPTV
jgi:PIN like domain